MTGIFWGMSGLTGNLALLCLLGYGESAVYGKSAAAWLDADDRRNACVPGRHLGRRPHIALDVQRVSQLPLLLRRPDAQLRRRFGIRPDWLLHRPHEG